MQVLFLIHCLMSQLSFLFDFLKFSFLVAITTVVKSGEQIPPPPPPIKETHGLKVFTRLTVMVNTQMDKYSLRSGKVTFLFGFSSLIVYIFYSLLKII